MCGGASGAQTTLSAETGNFYQELSSAYQSEFKQYSGILNSLHDAWTPVLNGGINQQGFSPSELAVLNGNAINSTAANYKAASAAVGDQLAARGGGNSFLPSGTTAQIDASIATKAAQQLSTEQNQITLANYAQGRQNFQAASGALSGVAQLDNPTGFAGAASGVGDQAFKMATQINAENNSWKNDLIGAVTGLGEAALGAKAPNNSTASSGAGGADAGSSNFTSGGFFSGES
jgi:hypothetical protein